MSVNRNRGGNSRVDDFESSTENGKSRSKDRRNAKRNSRNPSRDRNHQNPQNYNEQMSEQVFTNQKLEAQTATQKLYLRLLNDMSTHIMFGVGPAGSGKTYMAAKWAALRFQAGIFKKIIIVRPSVTNGEKLGFLPGDLQEKLEPLLLPILDVFEETFGRGKLASLINLNKIEFAPIGFMRGRTFKDAVIILDEAQNATASQMKMVLTRLGEGSKMIITGDTAQSDVTIDNGLLDFINRFTAIEGIEVVNFNSKDVVRHHLITEILKMYDDPKPLRSLDHSKTLGDKAPNGP